ncbi:DNA-3-methyladenine glycosylase 2 family protein [Bacillaceae bacterium Marseille-Q3522]|nr:DNA-3-methyladenine glycosylase 2 family protein [Bacillaceae bacterium Marseille-Q3522]
MEKISIKGPYHFDQVLNRLMLDPLHKVNLQKRTIKVPLIIDGNPVAATVTAVGTTEKPAFLIEPFNEKIFAKLTAIFQWQESLLPIHKHFLQTKLKDLFAIHYGTPLILDFDPYNCLLKCIIHQQLNLAFAYKLTERFVRTFGFTIDDAWFYPQPEKVTALSVEELRELQFSGRKAEYVIGIAREIAEGRLDLYALAEKSAEEITEKLIKLRGVGPWTVQNFLLFGLGRKDLFPAADIGLQNALKKIYQLDRKPTPEEMEAWQQDWKPYRSYASLYLWRSIEKNNGVTNVT